MQRIDFGDVNEERNVLDNVQLKYYLPKFSSNCSFIGYNAPGGGTPFNGLTGRLRPKGVLFQAGGI